MKDLTPEVKCERFSIADASIYYVFAFCPKDTQIKVSMNKESLPFKVQPWKNFNSQERMDIQNSETIEALQIVINLPNRLPEKGNLEILTEFDGKKVRLINTSVDKLKRLQSAIPMCIDQIRRNNANSLAVSGWVASEKKASFEAKDEKGNFLGCRISYYPRADVQAAYPEEKLEKECGFQLAFDNIKAKSVNITIKADSKQKQLSFPMGKFDIAREKTVINAKKSVRYIRTNGMGAFCKKLIRKAKKVDGPLDYKEWIKHNFASPEQLEEQRKTKFDYEPLISIVVPLYKTPKSFLDALICSVKEQTYSNWELVLSDGSGKDSPIAALLEKYEAEDKRIKVLKAKEQYRIVENTNRALEKASGEYIAFGDHDDLFAPDALFEVVKALNKNKKIELIYTDEDKTDATGSSFFEPQMKPDFNLDLLRTVNYICHLTVIEKKLLDRIGFLRSEYEGAQDYDLVLRAIENTKEIYHIPKVLYHWRSHIDSTAENPESKRYAFDAGRRAIQEHYNRSGINAEVFDGEYPGLYRTRYIRSYDPLISIIIPNKDHTDDLKRCIDSIEELSTYKNYEYIIIENNSDQEETFEFYKKLEKENKKVHVVYYDGNFNYSLINNFGVQYAKGEYLLLLNNDTSLINPDCLEEMLGYCMRDDVGIVGARLYYEDDSIQHAGVVIGFGGIAGHCFVMHPKGATGYCHRIICAQDYSAVTAACMMVDRKAFDAVNGLSDDLAVAFNDIDFCLRVREKGYLVVYNPYAELHHYESKSRGLEDTPEKVARFNREIETFAKKWGDFLEKGDPYYSPNLTLDSQDFSLRKNF